MNEKQIQEVMALVDHYAHVYAFVGDDTMPRARAAVESTIRQQLTDAQSEAVALRATEQNLRQQLEAANERIGQCEGALAIYRQPIEAEQECVLLRQRVAELEAQRVPDVDALTDKIAEGLRGTWHCMRVWEAWHVGTMGIDDFEPVDESETPREIAEAVLAMLSAAPTQPAQAEQPYAQIGEQVRVMLASSTELIDADGAVAGYQIKTGALHRIIGLLSDAGAPVKIPAAARRSAMLSDSANASTELLGAMSKVLDLTADEHGERGKKRGVGFDGETFYRIAAAPQREPMTDERKRDLVTSWFAEDCAIKAALGMLGDYETILTKKEQQ